MAGKQTTRPRPRKRGVFRGRGRAALSRLELEVMNVVWELGDCTSAQVIAAFTRQRALAPTTIRTVLTKLREKGYVKPIPSLARGFTFRATVRRETVARRSLNEVVAALFQDSPRHAIAYLLDEGKITGRELDELRRMLDARKRKGR